MNNYPAWLGGFINTVGGIGAAIITLPILTYFFPIHFVIAINCVCGTAITVYLGLSYIKYCNWRAISYMLLGSIPGSFLGYSVLIYIPNIILQGSVGILLILYALYLKKHIIIAQKKESPLGAFSAALFSGILNMTTSIGGPPLAMYAIYSSWDRNTTVGTLNFFYIILSLFTIFGQIKANLYSQQMIEYCLIALMGLIIGVIISRPIIPLIDLIRFRKILLVLIGSSGIMCLINIFITAK